MLPALRFAAVRRLPSAQSTFRQNTHFSPLRIASARWASNGNRKKNVLSFNKDEKSGPSTPIQPKQPKSEEPIEEQQDAPPKPSMPLPDLRYGIPSTFEAEYMKGQEQTGEATSHKNLDITDADAETERPRSSGGAGGEIPKSAYESSIDKRRNKMARYFFITALLAGVGGTVFAGRDWESEEEARRFPDAPSGFGVGLFYNRIAARLGDQMGYYTEPTFPKLLPIMEAHQMPPYTLVFSLEDFLVHSEWTRENGWRTAKRPGCDFFLLYLTQYFELVLFTSVPMGIADPVIRKLDPYHLITWPLFREATRYEGGDYVKVCIPSYFAFDHSTNTNKGSLVSQPPH
jgi:import inner membrane translocase subunit TIM50